VIKPYADNCVIELEPLPTVSESGLALVHTRAPGAREHRTARVLASGPGYFTRLGALVPNTVKPGDRVVVDAMAGDRVKWDMDLTAPRQNAIPEMDHLLGERGAFRVVRESEILAVVQEEAVAAE
jgi:co-chaperonin GroES (HSP10)